MPSLKGMRERTDELKVSWGGEDTRVVWRPALLTMDFYEELSDRNDEWREGSGRSSRAFVKLREMLAEVIADWDLFETDDPNSPKVPINPDTFSTLPDGFVVELLDQIMEEGAGGKARQLSERTERPVGRRETSRGGQHSFE